MYVCIYVVLPYIEFVRCVTCRLYCIHPCPLLCCYVFIALVWFGHTQAVGVGGLASIITQISIHTYVIIHVRRYVEIGRSSEWQIGR